MRWTFSEHGYITSMQTVAYLGGGLGELLRPGAVLRAHKIGAFFSLLGKLFFFFPKLINDPHKEIKHELFYPWMGEGGISLAPLGRRQPSVRHCMCHIYNTITLHIQKQQF